MVCQCTLLHAAQQETAYPVTSHQQQLPQLHIHNHIQNNSSTNNTNTHANTQTGIPQQTPIEKCLSHSGAALYECMECLSSKDFYQALQSMNPRQRRHYLDQPQCTMSAVKRLRRECPIQTWKALQKADPEYTASIEKAIHAYDQEGSNSVWGILGATILVLIAAASGCANT